jgi:hypothetical protein
MGLDHRLGPGEGRFEPAPLVGRDAVGEEARVAAQADGEPLDRLGRGARLAALYLGDVLLREALARELALREPGGNAKLTKPFSEAEGGRRGQAADCGLSGHAVKGSEPYASQKRKLSALAIPRKGHKQAVRAVKQTYSRIT